MVKEWKLRDAKAGDVIQSGQITLLFNRFEYGNCNFVIAFAGIDISGKLQVTDRHWLISNDARLATKEETDRLFELIAKEGYYWDKGKLKR